MITEHDIVIQHTATYWARRPWAFCFFWILSSSLSCASRDPFINGAQPQTSYTPQPSYSTESARNSEPETNTSSTESESGGSALLRLTGIGPLSSEVRARVRCAVLLLDLEDTSVSELLLAAGPTIRDLLTNVRGYNVIDAVRLTTRSRFFSVRCAPGHRADSTCLHAAANHYAVPNVFLVSLHRQPRGQYQFSFDMWTETGMSGSQTNPVSGADIRRNRLEDEFLRTMEAAEVGLFTGVAPPCR